MKYFMKTLALFIMASFHVVAAVELPDFTVLAEEQGNKVVNISASKEMEANEQMGSSMQDETCFHGFSSDGS